MIINNAYKCIFSNNYIHNCVHVVVPATILIVFNTFYWNLRQHHLKIECELDQQKPCTAELFLSIFHSFEAGIANTIPSFK